MGSDLPFQELVTPNLFLPWVYAGMVRAAYAPPLFCFLGFSYPLPFAKNLDQLSRQLALGLLERCCNREQGKAVPRDVKMRLVDSMSLIYTGIETCTGYRWRITPNAYLATWLLDRVHVTEVAETTRKLSS